MNNLKSYFASFLFVGLFAFSSFANGPVDKKPESINKQLSKLLKGIEHDVAEDTKTIYVDFMINDKAEIIVVSTSDKNLDQALKSKLNYKKLEAPQLNVFEKYTAPVKFKKEG